MRSWQLNALAATEALTQGDVTAVELVTGHLERIAAVNPQVNAVTNVLTDQALAAAADLDRRRSLGQPLGPLAGAVFTVKENIHVAGSATTHGAARFRDLVPEADAPPVRRLRAAGAIPIARTNMSTLSINGHHSSELYGETRNPWDPTRTPGGSSMGDSVAVATGMTQLGLGNDSGGSIRMPAVLAGVAGLKPSYGRYPLDHRLGAGDNPTLASQLFPVDGPIARSVADLRAVHQVLAGTDPVDPRAVPVPCEGPRPDGPIRVGVVTDPDGQGVHPDVRAAVAAAAEALADAGYLLAEVELPRFADALEGYRKLVTTEFALVWPRLSTVLSEADRHHMAAYLDLVEPADLAEYVQLPALRLAVQREWALLMRDHPLILGPVHTDQPAAATPLTGDPREFHQAATALRLCSASTFVGVPAVAVPTGVADGLPQGVQVIGQPYREDLCLAAARAVEDRLGVLTPRDPVG